MQLPHYPPHTQHETSPSIAIRAAVAVTVAIALGGYTLALGFTGIPVLISALGGLIAGLVLIEALTD